MRRSRFFSLCAIEGAIPLIALLLIPSEGGSISPARLGLISSIVILILFWIYCGRFTPQILDRFAQPVWIVLCAFLSLMFSLSVFLLRYLNPETLLPIYERLSPLLWYLLALSIQLVVYLLFIKNGSHFDLLRQNKQIFAASLTVLSGLILVLIFVFITKLGITKDNAYWGEPGVPILGWQLLLAVVMGTGVLVWQGLTGAKYSSGVESSKMLSIGILLPGAIYLAACILWLNVPVDSLRNSFYAPITLPYTTPFPYSDAGFYDYLSQSLLIGMDYFGGIPPRPLYVTFLAALHFIFGQDYVRIINAQTAVFALFPITLYWLGMKLHSRAAGVAVALFAIFRELTTLWISSDTRTASTKMFVTDFATSLGVALTILFVIRWLERRNTKSVLIAGGTYGLLLLLRTQSLIILPFIFVLAWFAFQKRTRDWFFACITFGLVMTATITPWLIHNYTVTGKFTFDDPKQMAVIFSQYSFDENLDLSQFDFETESVGRRIVSFTLENPAFVGSFIANHFLNTEIGGLLALPLIERFNGLLAPVNLYWIDWDGSITWYNFALLLIYLIIIAIGIGAAWSRYQSVGLVPLVFNLGYALANGISRFSSWRYNLPVDWVIYFYMGIGVIEIMVWISIIFNANASNLLSGQIHKLPRDGSFKPAYAYIVVAFVLIGSLPWLSEGFARQRYTSTDKDLKRQVAARLSDVTGFLSQPNAQVIEGKLLYPRFFHRDDGIISSRPWSIYAIRDFSRMGFLVINESVNNIIFPTNQPSKLIHGADVIVLGCQHTDYMDAHWIYFPETNEIYQSDNLNTPCPF